MYKSVLLPAGIHPPYPDLLSAPTQRPPPPLPPVPCAALQASVYYSISHGPWRWGVSGQRDRWSGNWTLHRSINLWRTSRWNACDR